MTIIHDIPEKLFQVVRYAAFIFSFVLVYYVGYLVYAQYRSQVALDEIALHEAAQENERLALSLGYFFTERMEDLKNISESRALSVYFENKALEMSMEYGLRASILALQELIEHLQGTKTLQEKPIYERIVFYEQANHCLVEVPARPGSSQENSAQPQLAKNTTISYEYRKKEPQLIFTFPCAFKNRNVGRLFAWISIPRTYRYFLALEQEPDKHPVAVAYHEKIVFTPEAALRYVNSLHGLLPADLTPQKPYRFVLAGDNRSGSEALIIKTPIKGTPLSLVKFVDFSDKSGRNGPKRILYTLGGLALVILAGIFLLFRLTGRYMIVRTRLEEIRLREKEVADKNRALQGEIAERVRIEQELEHLAYFDMLTDLPNRLLFIDRLDQAISGASRTSGCIATLFLDLDHFKLINDTMGHSIGDQLLMEVAKRLSLLIRKSDTVARMGGDEFVIILSRVTGSDDVAHVSQKIIDNIIAPFEIQGQEIFITTSIGIALFPDDGDTPAALLKNADIAMYQAKQNGRDNFQFFTAEMNLRTHERLSIESNLRYAVARDEFLLHFQPWQDLATGKITGVEALIRWEHPSEGMIEPLRFIPIAEDCGLIVPIGEWALKHACTQVKTLQEAGFPHLKVAVNLSGRQFKGTNLAVTVAKVLQETGLDPACLELEITESIVMADTKETQVVLRQLQEMGVSLSVDDFGTGYSSLGYLKRLPIAKLKIDQSFISDLCNSADNVAITRAIISMAKSLNLKVTAEGVEQKDQLELLRQLGCDMVQGYFICKPMPLLDLLNHLRATQGVLR